MVYLPNMNGRWFLNGKCVGYTPSTPEHGWLEDYFHFGIQPIFRRELLVSCGSSGIFPKKHGSFFWYSAHASPKHLGKGRVKASFWGSNRMRESAGFCPPPKKKTHNPTGSPIPLQPIAQHHPGCYEWPRPLVPWTFLSADLDNMAAMTKRLVPWEVAAVSFKCKKTTGIRMIHQLLGPRLSMEVIV